MKPKIMTRTQVKEVSYTPIDIEKKLNEELLELHKQDENTKVIIYYKVPHTNKDLC